MGGGWGVEPGPFGILVARTGGEPQLFALGTKRQGNFFTVDSRYHLRVGRTPASCPSFSERKHRNSGKERQRGREFAGAAEVGMGAARKIRVAVVFGGRSAEHAVSCASAGLVLGAIDRDRYEVVPIGIARDGRWVLTSGDPARLALTSGSLPSVDEVATPGVSVTPTAGAAAGRSCSAGPRRCRLSSVRSTSWCRCCTEPSARTGRSRGCSRWPGSSTRARGCSPVPRGWTRST